MFSFPATLIFGIVGVIRDRQKLLAIMATLFASGMMLLWAYMIAR